MRMLDIDVSEIDELSKITENEALDFLEEGVEVICRINSRDFMELTNKLDLEQCKKLKEEQIYDRMELYIE